MDRGMECIKTTKAEDCDAVGVVRDQSSRNSRGKRGCRSSDGCRGSESSRGRRVGVREPQLNRV